MKIYIAGPIYGPTDYEERFEEAERAIQRKGHEAINPVHIRSVIETVGANAIRYDKLMNICKALVDACDAIYMMPGWQRSNGARQEHDEAVNKGLRFFASMAAVPETDAARAERVRKYRQEG